MVGGRALLRRLVDRRALLRRLVGRRASSWLLPSGLVSLRRTLSWSLVGLKGRRLGLLLVALERRRLLWLIGLSRSLTVGRNRELEDGQRALGGAADTLQVLVIWIRAPLLLKIMSC